MQPHTPNTLKIHAIHRFYVTAVSGVKGLLAADWSKLQTLMNMSASTKNEITPEFRTFRTDSQLTICVIFLIIVANG